MHLEYASPCIPSIVSTVLYTILHPQRRVFNRETHALGPITACMFCLTIYHMVQELKSDFKVFYLDDGTIGCSSADIVDDLIWYN